MSLKVKLSSRQHKQLKIGIAVIIPLLVIIWLGFWRLQQVRVYPKVGVSYSCDPSYLESLGCTQVDLDSCVGWTLESSNKTDDWVIVFPGNYQNCSDVLTESGIKDTLKDYNILCVDYPGYGLSDGEPSDESIKATAINAYDYLALTLGIDTKNINILGYSIGTGPATYAASECDINKLVLVAPYDKMENLYSSLVGIFKFKPMQLLCRYRFNLTKFGQNVEEETLIISSTGDEIIGLDLSNNLKNYIENSVFEPFIGIGHNEYFSTESVVEAIQSFLSDSMES